ncbi:1-aminocyclopropane-1-carboxylate deaminase [Penicillium rolfsii]|nr:1-aminocyclopropane-1-carboxylate deaminase [Penicillium rolfsii]
MKSRIAIQLPPPFAQIPRHPILYPDPSPIHPLHAISSSSTTPQTPLISIFAKREDQGSPLACTGNKYRKLEYIIPDIVSPRPIYHYHEYHPTTQPLQGPATILVTEGALQSNHTVQVAALARKLGLKALVLLNKDAGGGYKTSSAPESFAKLGNVQVNKLLGAEIRMYNADDPETADAQPVLEELVQSGHRPYWIPGGASLHALGGLGYARAAFEIAGQESELQLGGSGHFDFIFVACGSGSTVAGLISGFKLLEKLQMSSSPSSSESSWPQRPRNIIGILNSPTKPRGYHEERVLRFARRAGELIGLENADKEITMDDVRLDDRFVGEGYGVVDEETRRSLSMMAEREGVVLDPVYTAKVAAGMIHTVQSEEMARYAQAYGLKEVNVLFVHTGGQAALSAYFDRVT